MSKELDPSNVQNDDEDMASEYAFDYTKARPNRFAPHLADGSLVVVLDPDIAEVFTTPESVKKVLRALVETMPKPRQVHTLLGSSTINMMASEGQNTVALSERHRDRL